MKPLETWEWDNLTAALKKSRCAIFLGHGLLSDATDGLPQYNRICDKLQKDCASLIEQYYEDGNTFRLKTRQAKTTIANAMEKEYNALKDKLEPKKRNCTGSSQKFR